MDMYKHTEFFSGYAETGKLSFRLDNAFKSYEGFFF